MGYKEALDYAQGKSPGILLLERLYEFSAERGFRYGLNEKYIPDKIVLQSLFDKRLIFYKKRDTNIYWLPTKAGRAVVEGKETEEEKRGLKLEVGVYEVDGEVFLVKPNREKTRLYAKKLVEAPSDRLTETGEHIKFDFVYDKGAIYRIRPEHRMSIERAKQLMIRYGRCIVCGHRLKVAESVERGIGPVCIKAFRR